MKKKYCVRPDRKPQTVASPIQRFVEQDILLLIKVANSGISNGNENLFRTLLLDADNPMIRHMCSSKACFSGVGSDKAMIDMRNERTHAQS